MYFDLLSHRPTRRRRLARWLSSESLFRSWKHSRALILAITSALALVLGVVGFALQYPRDNAALDTLYRTLQLFTLDGNVDKAPNAWLQIARYLAPLVLGYAAISVVLGLYHEQFRWLRIRGLRGHVVIAGLGHAGLMMATAFDRDNWRVIAIEADPTNPAIESARERGIWVVMGDATDQHILRRAGVEHAVLLVVMCGNDGTNVDVASAARRVYEGRRTAILTTVVELLDFELWQIMKAQTLVDRTQPTFRIELFNIYGLAAQMLIEEHPPFESTKLGLPHVLVVGMDGVGMSLIIEIVKRWQATRRPDSERLRITIADRSADALSNQLHACYPELGSIEALDVRAWSVDVSTLGRIAHVPEAVTAIYVCLASETQGLAAALALRQHPGLWDEVPIALAVSDESAGVGAAARQGGPALDHVAAFGTLRRTLTPEALLHTATETIARLGHEFYVREQALEGNTAADDPSLVPWQQLSPDLRESNRLWADGIAAHLLNLRVVVAPAPLMSPDEPIFAFAKEEVERLAPLEHERWQASMTRLGYTWGPKRTERAHPMIGVPFDQLPEQNKDKDRVHVRAIPAILAAAGFRMSRLTTMPELPSREQASRAVAHPSSFGTGDWSSENLDS